MLKVTPLGIFAALLLAAPARAQTPTLYAVGYAHLDTEWRWSYPQVIRQFLPNTMQQNFALFGTYPDYIFNFTGSNRYRMMKEYYPADFATLKAYVAAGRWFPAGSSVEEGDVNVPSPEALIRQVLYGNHFFRAEFNKASNEFMLPDCFGFPASLPTILAHCGMKGFSTQKLTWGSAVGIPFNVGLWVGVDGTPLLSALNPGAYVTTITSDLSNSSSWLSRINSEGAASGVYKDYMYYGTGDQGGAPTTGSVQWMQTSVHGSGPVHVISATAEQMFLDIPDASTGSLPQYKGDLLLTQHSAGSITSQGYVKRWTRKNELLADAAERTSIFAEWLGGPAYPSKRLYDAWILVMGDHFHDILPGTALPKAIEFAWNDQNISMNQFAGVLDDAIGSLAGALDTTAQGVPLIVFNPLSVDRQDLVEAVVKLPGGVPNAVRVVGPDGLEVPSQILSVNNGAVKILFQATIPSVGMAVYDVQPAATPAASAMSVSPTMLENARYQVTIDANGDVSGIYDKVAGRAILTAPARMAFLQDTPTAWPAWNIDFDDNTRAPQAYLSSPLSVRVVENGAARVAVQIVRDGQESHFVQTIRLSAGDAGNRVEFANTIDWQSSQVNLKAVFPLTSANSNATYNWEVGTIQRNNDNSVKYEVPSHQWIDLSDANTQYGVTLLTDCKYGSDKPDNQTLRLTLLRTPGSNSSIGYQDQTTQDWGRHEILYGLTGHAGDWRTAQTDWQGLRLNQPPIAFVTTSHGGSLGKTVSLLRTNNPRVRILALKKAEDSNEVILRLVELDGLTASNVHVIFPASIASAREVNGQEQPIGPATITGGELVTDIRGYGLRSFALTLGASPAQITHPSGQAVTLPYNRSVTSNDGQASAGGIDDANRCIPAEQLPPQIAYRGINFQLAAVAGGQPNAVQCAGQSVSLPVGNFNRLYLLATAANGSKNVTFIIDGAPAPLTIQDWGGYIGQWYNRVWFGTVPEAPPTSWTYPLVGMIPAYVRNDSVAWFCSHRHTSAGANEYYAYCYLYAYAIDLPPGAQTLTLPTNANVYLLAATVANDPAASTTPALPLVDQPATPSKMTPVTATGWNRDIVVEASAASPLSSFAQPFDTPNNYAYYEHGLSGGSSRDGLPVGGNFTSNIDQTTQVQLQPYNAANALFLNSATPSGTLTFAAANQRPYEALALFAATANGANTSVGTLSITFTDGSAATGLTYKAYDWFFHVGDNALANLGRVTLNGSFDNGASYEPRIYQTTLDLAALALNRKSIQSLTFGLASGTSANRSTIVVAVSGLSVLLPGDLNCDAQITPADAGPFVQALTNPPGYQTQFAACDIRRADVNGDGLIDGADVRAFVALLLHP